MEEETLSVKILMFPWVGHGHIFPYLELAKRILMTKHFHIYFCSTSINFSSIKSFIQKNLLHNSIELVELHLEPHPELPPRYHTTKNLPSDLNCTLIKAFQTSKSDFSKIITTLSPQLVIYDFCQPWAAKIALSKGIPAVHFSVNGVGALSFMHHHHTYGKEPVFPFQAIHFHDFELKHVMSMFEFLYENVIDVDIDFLFGNFKNSCEFVLVKTCKQIEGKYIDYLSSLSNKKIVSVGPLIDGTIKNGEGNSKIMKWLSKKDLNSTLYISFGSEYFLSKEEIQEIAKGLELCDVNFIWIIRFPLGMTVDLESILPENFHERVAERGIVVTGWAPQQDILSHPSTCGFMSHCGWSSVMESLYFGVPVIGMPMQLDQPINAKILSEVGSCVEVLRYENKVFNGEDIGNAINKLVVEGEGMRRCARELSEKMKMEEEKEIDDVVEHLWQLALKNKK